jgi:hypothetical protein
MGISSFLFDEGLTNVEFIRTGDILLFNSEPQKGALLVMTSTRSVWTHIGIAVWSNDTPRRLLILESGYGQKQFDELTGTERTGVRLTELKGIINRYQAIHVRSVKVTRDVSFFTKLTDFMQEWKGTNYISLVKIPLIPFIQFNDGGVSCAEFVARYFKAIGLFDDKPALNNYPIKNFLPRNFAPGGPNEIDTSGLFVQSFSPIVYRSSAPRFDSVLLLTILTIGATLLGGYVLLINKPPETNPSLKEIPENGI